MRFIRGLTLMAVTLGMLAGVALAPAKPASADDWCWNDPVVSIEGHIVQILTGVQGSPKDVDANVDAAEIKIIVPRNARTQLLMATSNLYAEHTLFQKSREQVFEDGKDTKWHKGDPIPVRVEVSFTAKKQMPAQVTVNHKGKVLKAKGHTKSVMVVEFTIDQ